MAPYVVLTLLGLLGVRLIMIGWRARSWAEAFLGGTFLMIAPASAAMRHGTASGDTSLSIQGLGLSTVGISLLVAFTYRTFRHGELLGMLVMAALIALNVAGYLHQVQIVGTVPHPSAFLLLARAGGFGWTAFESTRFLRMYRKREVLGLADPVITNRFLLYAIWTTVVMLVPLIMAISGELGEQGAMGWQNLLRVLVPPAAIVVVVCVVLTFVPPRAYLRFIERRHASRSQRAGGLE